MFRKKQSVAAAAAQLRGGTQGPFGAGLPAVPPGEAQLYRAMRQSLPVLDAAIGKLVRLSGGAKRPAADRAERIPADRSVRARADRHSQLSLGLSRQPSDLRPGRRRDARGAGRPAGRVLGRCERAGNPGGKVAPRGRAVRLRCGRPDAAAAAAGAAAVHGAEPGAGQPLWRLAAAQYAVSRGHPAENLPHDRKKLGARGQCALCRRLQAGRRRDGARLRLRAGRGHRRRVERGHARQPERRRARLCGRGRRVRQGHRRGRAGA